MRLFIPFFLLFCVSNCWAQTSTTKIIIKRSAKDSARIMSLTKTSHSCQYMTKNEKETLQWLNIARMYPKWFIYFNKLTPSADSFKNGLYNKLKTMRPIKEKLLPDSVLWSSAVCHAIYTGKTGFIGHERKGSNCPKKYSSECIHYGISSP